jgi:hypothetical protein
LPELGCLFSSVIIEHTKIADADARECSWRLDDTRRRNGLQAIRLAVSAWLGDIPCTNQAPEGSRHLDRPGEETHQAHHFRKLVHYIDAYGEDHGA